MTQVKMPFEVVRIIPDPSRYGASAADGFAVARFTSQGDATLFAIAATRGGEITATGAPRAIHEVLKRGKVVYRAG